MWHISLKNKIIIAMVLVICLFGSAATWFMFSETKSRVKSLQEDYLKVIALDQATTIHQMFINSRDIVGTMAAQPAVVSYLSSAAVSSETVIELLKTYNISEAYSSIMIFDTNGRVLASTDADLVDKHFGFRSYFQEAVKGQPGYDIVFGKINKENGYYFANAVKDSEGRIIGVVAAKYPSNFIEMYIKRGTLNLYGHYIFVDSNGIILHSANSNEELHALGRTTRERSFLKERYGDVEMGDLGYDELQKAVDNFNGATTVHQSWANSNRQYIFALNKLGGLPFFLILGEEQKLFGDVAYDIALGISVMVLLSIIVVAILIYIMISNFLEPLTRLRKSIQQFGQGDVANIESIDTKDEVGDLSRAFIELSEKLQKAVNETERKVRLRTKELSKVNRYMIGRELKMIELKKSLADLKAKASQVHEDQN